MKVKSGGGTVQLSLEKIGQVGRFLGCGLVAGIKKGKVKWGKCPAVCIHRLHFRIRKMSCYCRGQAPTVSRTFVGTHSAQIRRWQLRVRQGQSSVRERSEWTDAKSVICPCVFIYKHTTLGRLGDALSGLFILHCL